MRLLWIFLVLIIPAAVHAQTDSTFLRGNWLKTDGSNALHFGVFEKAVCYNNKVWKIKSNEQSKLMLENGADIVTVAIKKKDDNSIELSSGKERVILKKQRTFSSKFKPTKEKLQAPYVRPAEVTISGVIYSEKLKTTSLENRYLTISYNNELTNDEELAFGDIDDEGRFELKLMLYRPQVCRITFNNEGVASIFVQPGSSMVLATNMSMEINRENPDYDIVAQRIGFMGDDATFNNLYQHFMLYSATREFPDLKFSPKVHAGKTVSEKKTMIFEWHKIKEDQLMEEMGYVYPEKTTEARFTGYIRDEIRYVVAESLVSNFKEHWSEPSNLKIDSADMAKIRALYLVNLTPQAMNHSTFYKFVRQYAYHKIELKTHGTMRYSVDQQKMKDRVMNEYAPLLPATFINSYEKIMSEIGTVNFQMDEKNLMERYFNGSEEQMNYFEVMFRHIRDKMAREVKDTIDYENNIELFPDPLVRYVANIKVLDDNDSEYKTPSLYRLTLYKRYSKGGAGPWRSVDSLRRQNIMFTGFAGLAAKASSRSIDDIQDEAQWQDLLTRYKGKTLVFWLFSGRYTTASTYSSLHEIKKMKKQFAGRNVVFIKIILERNNAEAHEHMMSYIEAFAHGEEFHDIYRIRSNVSLNGLRSELINNQAIIYGDNGLVHHPEYFFYRYDDPRRGMLSFVKELEQVLNGHGTYNEKYANEIFSMPFSRSSYGLETFRWTHVYTSGPYHTYQYKEPKERDYRLPNDSILHQFVFRKKDSVIEQTLYLQKKKGVSHIPIGRFSYSYDPEKYVLTITDKSAIRKKYRVVLITNELMLLELLD